MCENCNASAPQIRPSAALIARTREIEAALPGDRVEDAAFEVFFGQRGGSIPWQQYQRLVQCMKTALESLPRRMLSCDDGATETSSPRVGAENVRVRWGRTNHTRAAGLSPDGGARGIGRLQGAGVSSTSP